MRLDIWFSEDIRNALLALDQASERTLALAEIYGMDPEIVRACRLAYNGALSDVGQALGLSLGEPARTTLTIPARMVEREVI